LEQTIMMTFSTAKGLCLVAVAAMLAMPACDTTDTRDEPAPRVAIDRPFIEQSVSHNLLEIELARLARERSQDEDIRQFAQMIEQHHQTVNDRLRALAAQRGERVPTQLDTAQRTRVRRITELSGEAFDREFLREMVRTHERSVSRYERQQRDTRNPAVRDLVADALPLLRQHLEEARQLARDRNIDVGQAM